MNLLLFSARASGILIMLCLFIFALLLYYKRLRNFERLDQIPKGDQLAIWIMYFFGALIFFHVGYHRYLFTCQYPLCKSKATFWLIGYAVAFLMQPIVAGLRLHAYAKRDYYAWLVIGMGSFWLLFAAGKAQFIFVYLWGREIL